MAVDPNAPDPFANIVPPSTVTPVTPIATPLPQSNGFQPPFSQQPTFTPTGSTAAVNTNPFAYQNSLSNCEGPSWKFRKRIAVYTLIFCAGVIAYLLFKGTDTRLNETLAQSAFALAGATLGSLIFGGTWHDISINK